MVVATAYLLCLAACLIPVQQAMADAAASSAATDACCEFARSSVAVQRELAAKVKRLNGRRVYLFDATGFSAAFVDEKTVDNIRYNSGVVDDVLVDAVLSQAAQRSLAGPSGARTLVGWTDPEGLTVDKHGVYM